MCFKEIRLLTSFIKVKHVVACKLTCKGASQVASYSYQSIHVSLLSMQNGNHFGNLNGPVGILVQAIT